MFTQEQIDQVNKKNVNGGDFPRFIQELKNLGVNLYYHFVTNGATNYYGDNQYELIGQPMYANIEISQDPSTKKLQESIEAHKKGEIDYIAFNQQTAAAGVEKWIVDLQIMTVTYLDLNGNTVLEEHIPKA